MLPLESFDFENAFFLIIPNILEQERLPNNSVQTLFMSRGMSRGKYLKPIHAHNIL